MAAVIAAEIPNIAAASPTKITSKAYKRKQSACSLLSFLASCSSIHLNAFMWLVPDAVDVSIVFFSPLNLCDKPKLTKTKLFVHANMIKWKPRSVPYRHPIYTTDAFCLTSSLVDRLMTKLCWWKLCKHDEDTRRFYPLRSVRRFLSFLPFRVFFFLLSLHKRQSKLMNWQCSFHWSLGYTSSAHDQLNDDEGEKKAFIFICIKNGRKKSKSKWFVAHTHSLVRPEWLRFIYMALEYKVFARRSNAIGLFTVRL